MCAEFVPDIWIDVERGRRAPKLFQQVLGQRDDFAIVMLWLETPEEDDDEEQDRDEDRTSKDRFRSGKRDIAKR